MCPKGGDNERKRGGGGRLVLFELRFIPKAIFAFVVPKSDCPATTTTTKKQVAI